MMKLNPILKIKLVLSAEYIFEKTFFNKVRVRLVIASYWGKELCEFDSLFQVN